MGFFVLKGTTVLKIQLTSTIKEGQRYGYIRIDIFN